MRCSRFKGFCAQTSGENDHTESEFDRAEDEKYFWNNNFEFGRTL
jgi:hypothetical protein